MPLRNIQQNIEIIEKETELVCSSYQEKLAAMKKQVELEEKKQEPLNPTLPHLTPIPANHLELFCSHLALTSFTCFCSC